MNATVRQYKNKLQENADLYGDLDEAYIRIGADIMFKGKSFTTSKWRAKQLYRLSKAYGELGGIEDECQCRKMAQTHDA